MTIADKIPGLPPCAAGRQFIGFDKDGHAYVMQWRDPFMGAPGSFACIGFDHRGDGPGAIAIGRQMPLFTIIPFEAPFVEDEEGAHEGEPAPAADPFIVAHVEIRP